MGGFDFIDQPVEGQCLLMDPGSAVGCAAGIDQVAVVIPFDVADLVFGEDVEDGIPDVGTPECLS
jgi:hypothetical protein